MRKHSLSLNALNQAVKLSLLSSLAVAGASFADTTDAEPSVELAQEVVVVSADASQAGLKKAYAGGQVARGARVGVLGNQDNLDTPFSTVAYTNEYINNQQASTVGDVLKKTRPYA